MTRPTRRQLVVGGAILVLLAATAVYLLRHPGGRTVATARDAADRREFATALELLKEPLDHPRADPDALLLGARTARRAGRPELADRYLRRYVERGGDAETAAIERILGTIQRGELGTFAGGVRFCEKNPGHPEATFALEAMTQGYLKAGHLTGAMDTATRWLATDPSPADKAQALVWRGNCYRNLGNLDQALADARSALASAPDFIEAHALAADALTGSDPDAALRHYAVVLAADPGRVEARLGVARCRRNRGEAATARAELDRVLRGVHHRQPGHRRGVLQLPGERPAQFRPHRRGHGRNGRRVGPVPPRQHGPAGLAVQRDPRRRPSGQPRVTPISGHRTASGEPQFLGRRSLFTPEPTGVSPMKARLILTLSAVLFILTLTGCGDEKKPSVTTPEQEKAAEEGMQKYMKGEKK